MRIILSRKGFDTSNGGIPSPILPDGTLLSMPIPSDDLLTFSDLRYGEHTYREILRQLSPNRQYNKCHLDPDIRNGIRIKTIPNWKPAFGQIGAAQSYLRNRIKAGDLFLFFGRFQETVGNITEASLHFDRNAPILHIIYGYMEIGEIISSDKIAEKHYTWHPHGGGKRLNDKTNTMYLPTETLSFDKNRRGWGTFDFSKNRVLTLSNKTATWREIPCLLSELIDKNVTNKAKGCGIYYQGIWQELVLKESDIADAWVNEIF